MARQNRRVSHYWVNFLSCNNNLKSALTLKTDFKSANLIWTMISWHNLIIKCQIYFTSSFIGWSSTWSVDIYNIWIVFRSLNIESIRIFWTTLLVYKCQNNCPYFNDETVILTMEDDYIHVYTSNKNILKMNVDMATI